MRPVPVVLLAALCLALLYGGWRLWGTFDEAAGLAAEGGERVLREPMRAARGADRVLVLALDGVGEALLTEALAAGDLPRLAAFLGEDRGDGLREHGVVVSDVPAVFPSETAAGWAAVYTGARPAVSGVTGNEWYDRDSLATFAPVPLSVGTIEQTLAIWSDSLFSAVVQAPTLFERADVRAHVSLGFVYRGADLLTPPDLSDLGDLVEAASGAAVGSTAAGYEEIDEDTVDGVALGVERYGIPDLQVAYFPGVDLVAHADGSEAQRAHLREHIDPHVGAILDLYRAAGALDRTTVVIVSDHGHAEALADDRHSLDDGDAGEPPALLDSLGYRLRDFSVAADSSDANVVMIYDEAVAMLYLANGATCAEGAPCDWSAAPRLDEDVLPLARALRDAGLGDSTAVGGLGGAVDLVLARASDPSGRTSPPYRVLDGGRLVAVGEYLRRTPRPDLFRFEERLGWLTDGPLGHRAGDVLVLLKSGSERPLEERFYFGSPRVSGHGGASPDESRIALVVARAGADGAALRAEVERAVGPAPTQLDVTDLILALLRR